MKPVVVIVGVPNGIARNRYKKILEDSDNDFEFLVLCSEEPEDINKRHKNFFHHIKQCDFSDPSSMRSAIEPFLDSIAVVTARSDINIPDFISLIPHLPDSVNLPTIESLQSSTEKTKMRQRFREHDPSITPKFFKVDHFAKEDIDEKMSSLSFPLIVKPSGLAASSFVSKVKDKKELYDTVRHIFQNGKDKYKELKFTKPVKVIVEEYMEGLTYSVDAYISPDGDVTFTPFVEYRNRAKDDFSPFIRVTPTELSNDELERAQEVAAKGIRALELHSLTAHVELMKTLNGWKVVEIGPRVGGNRDKLYTYAFGFNHAANDIFTRLDNRKPIVTTTTNYYSAIVFLYAHTEGRVEEINGIEEIKNLPSYKTLWVSTKPGDKFLFSKNGGKYVVKVTLAHKDQEILEKNIKQLDDILDIKIF